MKRPNYERYKQKHAFPRGVSKAGKKFSARIDYEGKKQYLGVYATPEEASAVYEEFRKEFVVAKRSPSEKKRGTRK